MEYYSTNTFSSSSVRRLPRQESVACINPICEFPYRENINNRLQELIRLELGWDGYRGKPINLDNAMFVITMLESIYSTHVHTSLPSIVPGVSGDLQIEWHYSGYTIELHIISPYNVCANFYHENNNFSEELELTSEFSQVTTWIRKMMQENTNAKTASIR